MASLAIRMVEPWGVDVASVVEGAAHRKDAEKIKRFVLAVRAAEAPPKTDEPK